MSDTATRTGLNRAAHVFPEAADMADWNALSPAEQLALIARAEEEGFESGEAASESLTQRLARVRGL
ncbi:MAG: hypothetical protein ABL864_15305 [Terricaulis sp.]